MNPLIPYLYQFVGGGIVLIAGYWGAVRSGALNASSAEDRRWTLLIFCAVLIHAVIQGAFQFLLSSN